MWRPAAPARTSGAAGGLGRGHRTPEWPEWRHRLQPTLSPFRPLHRRNTCFQKGPHAHRGGRDNGLVELCAQGRQRTPGRLALPTRKRGRPPI